MGANRREMDSSGQELIEGSSIAGEISSVNHTAPSPSAPPIEGRVNLSDDQRRERKRAADKRCNEKRKREKDELNEELKKLKEYSDELELENGKLKSLRDQTKALVDEENNKILSHFVNNYAGQNTEIIFTGETSVGQDGLNELRDVNQAPITSNTIFGENASMNLQMLPRSAQPAGNSGLPDNRKARKRIADKKCRQKRKCMIDASKARKKELKKKNVKLEADNAVLNAEADQLRKQFYQLRNISALLISKNVGLEKFLDGVVNCDQGSTLNTQQKIEDTERQLEKVRADYDELKKSHDELSKAHAYSNGLVDQARKDMEQIAGFNRGLQQIVARQNAWIDMHQQLLVAGTTGIDTGEIGLPVHHPTINQSGATMESGGRVIAESLPQLYQVGLPYPPLSDGGLTPGGDLFGSHGLNYTSPPGADMVSGSSLMEGSLAPGGQLSWGITPGNTFGTGEAGPSVHHPPVYPSGTTIRPEGPAIEYPPELSQSHLPQGWPHGNNSEQPTSYNADQSPGVD